MASVPGYDPNTVEHRAQFSAPQPRQRRPLLNRTTQAGYPPGSTFKVGDGDRRHRLAASYTPDSRISGRNGKYDLRACRSTTTAASTSATSRSPRRSPTRSTRSSARSARSVGKATMQKYMDRCGFGDAAEIDLPRDEMRRQRRAPCAGGVVPAANGAIDVGRMAIGQDKLTVTPLQMAMVAAAVANGGKLMTPRSPTGSSTATGARSSASRCPRRSAQVMSRQTRRAARRDDGAGRRGGHRHRRPRSRHRRGAARPAPPRSARRRDSTSRGSSASRPCEDPRSPIAVTRASAGPGPAAPSPPRSPKPVMQEAARSDR